MGVVKSKTGNLAIDDQKRKGPGAALGKAPAMGDLLKGIVPTAEQDGFMAFAAKRPRFMERIRNRVSDDEVKEEIRTAYDSYMEGKRSTALVKSEAARLVPVVGLSQPEVEGYLELYKPAQVETFATRAKDLESTPGVILSIDSTLLLDGSFCQRPAETEAVTFAHTEMTRVINKTLGIEGSQREIRKQDVNMDNLWDSLVTEFGGDEAQAAAVYADRATEILTNAKKKGQEIKPFDLSTEVVVEIFKLFNYDRGDLDQFVTYFEHNFSLKSDSPNPRDDVMPSIGALIGKFVAEKSTTLILNPRSKYYKKYRAIQFAHDESVLPDVDPQ